MTRPHHTAMLHWILGALGVSATTLAGCGGKVDFVTGQGGGGSGSSSSSSKSSSKSSSNVASTGSLTTGVVTVGASTGSGFCPQPISVTDVPVPANGPCSTGFVAQYVCFPLTSGVPCDQAYPKECVLEAYSCGFQEIGDQACGPDPMAMNCCYTVVGDCPVGRPFMVDGAARRAELVSTRAWFDGALAPDVIALDARTRAALEAYWGEEGLNEHASIASFSRFLLELLSLGAPLDLVQRAQRALAEEIDHARVCFALASAYAGAPRGPTALDLGAALGLGARATRASVACAIAREGCIAETIAAMQIADARDAATDPTVRGVLAAIADEEAEHALLAWRTLGWILDQTSGAERASLVSDLRTIFDAARSHVGLGPVRDDQVNLAAMRAHGHLPLAERRSLAHAALRSVVTPAADALLGRAPTQESERADEHRAG